MSAAIRIDAHQHFWQVDRGDYGWLEAAPEILRRDFLPAQLDPELDTAGITATVVVQAAPSAAETEFLLTLATQHPSIKGVVGWVDLADPHSPRDLERLAASPFFKGVRPMLQDIADPRWLTEQGRPEAFAALIERRLTFDALVLPRQLPTLIEFVGRYPDLPIVIDHAAKPEISGRPPADWYAAMRDLAQAANICCKYSGLATEVQGEPTRKLLQPYVDALLDLFTPERLIWGSDWPVLTTRMQYGEWMTLSEQLLADLPEEARLAIYGGNAIRFYNLELQQ